MAQTVLHADGNIQSKAKAQPLQIAAAAILGSLIILFVSLAPMDIVHNAAHDGRHSFAFPCH